MVTWPSDEYYQLAEQTWEFRIVERYTDKELTLDVRDKKSKRPITFLGGFDVDQARQVRDILDRFIRWKEGRNG